MKIKLNTLDSDMADMVYTIASAPASWENWYCLHVCDPNLAAIRHDDAKLKQIEIVMDVYLDHLEGWMFHNGGSDLFILTQNISSRELMNIGHHILTLVLQTKDEGAGLRLLSLSDDYERFLNIVLNEKYEDHYDAQHSDLVQPQKRTLDQNGLTRVLLIEDDEVTRWMVRRTLKEECFIATAADAAKAYAAFSSLDPDIVFLDLGLPDTNGFDVLRWIMERNPNAYVVIFSGQDDFDNREAAKELGAKGFINKPFLKDKLMRHIVKFR